MTAALARYHAREPERMGPPRDELLHDCAAHGTASVLRAVLDLLVREGSVQRDGACYRLPSHQVQLSSADARTLARLRAHLTPTTLKAPSVSDLAQSMSMDRGDLLAFLKQCERRGHVVRVADNRYFDATALAALAQMAETLAADGGRFDAKGFRDASGIGRNLTIDVLEYFDRKGFTRRVGDERVVVKGAEALFN